MCCSGGNYKHVRRNKNGGTVSVDSRSDKIMSVLSILILVAVVAGVFYFFM
ncbi:hypothetical protein SH2C18_13800 [Clostridium sediminicola]|uniref:hypothetical protein n=1 Tax=Clostridium sediminicola TaxID=3114879 RepID=UPI0031F1D678